MAAKLTDPAAIEAELRTQERQLAMIFNRAREMMMLVRVEPGVLFRVVSVNREYLNKAHAVGHRFTAEDFAGKTCDEVMALFGFPAATAALIRARYAQVIETRQVLAYDEDKSGPAGEFHGRTTLTPLLDEAGACAFVLYATEDITALKVAEQERSRSEGMLRAILDHAFGFIGLLDPAGRVLRANQTSLDAVGANRADVVGKYFWETPWWTHSPAEQARLREAVGRAAQGEFVRYETTHPTADGRELHIDFSLKPVRDERGMVVAIIPEGRDITERKAAEQALRESEEKFAKAFRASPQAMSIASMEDGRYVEINQAHQELFGYPPEEIIGRTPLEIGIVTDPTLSARSIGEIRARGRVKDLQLRARTRDGRVITVINSAELVHMGGRESALLISRDVTAQLQAEQALRDSEEKFAKAFLACPDAMSVHELDSGRYVDVNEGFLRLFGCTREEVIGRTPLELGFWQEATGRQSFVERLRQDGRVRHFNVRVRVRDGTTRVCELSAEKIEIGGRLHNVTVLQDITERLEAEQALRASEDKFARAFRASPDAISISELDTGRLVEVNEGFERLAGYTRAEMIGRTVAELGLWGTTGSRERLAAELQRAGSVRNMQVRLQNRRGQQGDFLLSAEKVQIGAEKCLVVMAHDIGDRLQAEQALRESEEKFAVAFRVSPDLISLSDYETGHYLEVNDAHAAFFGYRREELIGHSPHELGIITDLGPREQILEQLERDGHVRGVKVPARTRDGRAVVVSLSAEAIVLNGRKCILRHSHDITAALQAERALRESEEKFAKAFRASPDAISISDVATGKILEVNEGFERLSGYRREELIGRTSVELGFWISPEERSRMIEDLRRDGSVRDRQVRARSRDGEQRDYLMSAETVEIGGRPCLVILSHDISNRLAAERALRESENKFAKAFLSSPLPLIISEVGTGRYIDVNIGFERVSGYTREEIIGRTSLEVGIWENLEDRDALFHRLQRDGHARDMEINFRRKDGGRLITRCAFELIELAGRPCLLSTIEDITERRRAEAQKVELEAQLRQNQKLEALGTLAGGIAHDFNNILTAIIVNQELAQMDLDDPESVRRRLGEIGLASGRAKELVRQILTFSRQQQHERLRQHLQMIIREALGLLRASLPATIEISQDLSPDAPPVLADASQIHQVVMNLCTNAAHAMRDRPGRLTVRLVPRMLDEAACRGLPGLQPGPHAQLTVTDTGHGMDAAVLARIFEPFYTTKGPGEGTGLGLAMVHGIVRDHEGAIFVQSSPGAGTTFDLYFPAAVETAAEAPTLVSEIVAGKGETVLVVDDEEAICEAIGAMLRRIGYRVQTFTDAEEALERFKAAPSEYDLLLTDRTMPRISGPELIALVHHWWPGLPALLMSGLNNPDAPAETEVREAGGYGLVAKPIDIAELSRAVRRALQSSASR